MAQAPASASYQTSNTQPIECFIYGVDIAPRTNAFVVILRKDPNSTNFSEIGRTEVIRNNPNPEFQQRFVIDFAFEQEQFIRLDLYHQADARVPDNLDAQTLLGSYGATLAEIVHAPNCTYSKPIFNNGRVVKGGAESTEWTKLRIQAAFAPSMDDEIGIMLSGRTLKKMDMFGKSDPFYEIFRIREDGSEILVYKSETIVKNLNPDWPWFETTSGLLCNGDWEAPLMIRVWDEDRGNQRELIGQVTLSLRQIAERQGGSLRRDNGKDKTYGELVITNFKHVAKPSFLEYLRGGCDISCMFAIDFTNSNGSRHKETSLHYIKGYYETGTATAYQWALRGIGNILEPYDADQLYPVWGFGAKMQKSDSEANMCFPLNWMQDPHVHTMAGVEQYYVGSLTKRPDGTKPFIFSNPTHFAPILAQANEIAAYAHGMRADKQQYFVLVILTDGMVDDLQATKDQIVRAANENYPLSIVIVGIGNADFSAMRELDADITPITNSDGVQASRDIVQFVPVNQHSANFADLSGVTLAEIPQQFLSYMRAAELLPGPGRPEPPPVQYVEYTPVQMAPPVQYEVQYAPPPTDPLPPLPEGWEMSYDANGVPFYIDHNTRQSYWVHPEELKRNQQAAQEAGVDPAAGAGAAPASQPPAEENPFEIMARGMMAS